VNEYHSRGQEILRIFINNGYEAFFVGEAVRNLILKKTVKMFEITTSAHIEIVKKIFNDCLINDITDNMIELEYAGYNYLIKSFVGNTFKDSKNTILKHYSKNLLDDLASRDFSINAIAMSNSGKLTDAYDGYNDAQKGLISHIGNAKERFYKNPTLMIKAFSLISELNFKIVPKTKKAISRRKKHLSQCDVNLLIDEFKKMFEGAYAKKAISTMVKLKIYKAVPIFKKVLKRLNSFYKKQTFEEILLMTDVLNGKPNDYFVDYIEDYNQYIKTYDLIIANKNSKYDQLTLYSYGLKTCLYANKINYYLGRTRKKEKAINKKWDKLIIKNVDELNYRVDDLKKIIKEQDYSKIPFVLDEAVKLVLIGEIRNNKSDVEKGIIQVLQKNNIFYSLQGVNNIIEEENIPNVAVEPQPKIEEIIQSQLENNNSNIISNDIKSKINEEEAINIANLVEEIKVVICQNEYIQNINFDESNIDEELFDLIVKHIKEGGGNDEN